MLFTLIFLVVYFLLSFVVFESKISRQTAFLFGWFGALLSVLLGLICNLI